MLRLRAVLAFTLFAAASCFALPAGAEPSALPISLEFSGCESLDQAELLKLLAIEFQTLNVTPVTPLEQVRIACRASEASVTLAAASNRVDLAATAPAAWPRLLALSVSELVIEARARVTPAAEPAPPVAPPPAVPAVRPASKVERAARVRLFAGPALRRAVRSDTSLVGPQVGAELDVLRVLALSADARLEFGRTDTDLANVSWTSARGALVALIGGRVSRFRFGLGPGLCLGYLRLSPALNVTHASGRRVSGAWGGPELVARINYDLSAHWFVALHADSGIVTWPVSGLASNGRRLVDSGGAWLSGAAALGVQF